MRRLRGDFARIHRKYEQLGKGNVRLAQSSLVLSQAISNNKTTYQFSVLENDPINGFYPETRLNINDEFVATDLGIFLGGKIEYPTGAPFIRSAPALFTTSFMEMDRASVASEILYSGYFRFGVNNINYVDKWDIKKHEYRGVTQVESFNAVQPKATFPNIAFESAAMMPCTPTLTLSGAKKNELSIVLPTPMDGSNVAVLDQNGEQQNLLITDIVIFMRGFLAQNASKFQ